MSNKLEYIERFNNKDKIADYVIIWLHGLGADYNDFLPIVNEFNFNKSVKFIFPNAPLRPITINNGYVMRGWYDIRDFTSLDNNIDQEGIYQSMYLIENLIQEQIDNGVSPHKILLAGFSQGGVMSYVTAALTQYKLGAVIALSCYLPSAKVFLEKSQQVNLKTPIFASHGLNDEVVPYHAGVIAKDILKLKGYQIDWHEYPVGHQMAMEQVADLNNWINDLSIR